MSAPAFRPEHSLLLSLARLSLPASHREKARALVQAGVDWGLLASLARRQGLTLLVHRYLARDFADLCPVPVLEAMASSVRATVAVNLALAGELGRLLPGFESAGCRPVVLKGPALAVAVYGDLASRAFSDVDVVVEPSSKVRAWELLESRGYHPFPSIPPRWQETWRRSTHEQLFERKDLPLMVDLHWGLTARGYSYSMCLEEVRPRLVRVPVGAGEVWTLGPEDNLLFLCCHGMKHNWAALSWLVDVAELVRGQARLDWDAVVRWSREFGRRRPVQLGLHLAHRLLEAPIPAEVLAEGDRDPEVAALVGAVSTAFLDSSSAPGQGLWGSLVRSVWFRGTESWSDRVRFLHEWVLMPRPPDWEWVSLPAWAGPAYYVVRPLRLSLKHGRALLGFGPGR
jgi:hypothetical protein